MIEDDMCGARRSSGVGLETSHGWDHACLAS